MIKRAILAVSVAFAASSAMGVNWVYVTESSSSVSFQDTSSIRIDGEKRRVWELSDRKVNGTSGARSNRTLVEYDCKDDRSRFLQITNFRGQMATGDVISMSAEAQPWWNVEPGTTEELRLRAACKFVP